MGACASAPAPPKGSKGKQTKPPVKPRSKTNSKDNTSKRKALNANTLEDLMADYNNGTVVSVPAHSDIPDDDPVEQAIRKMNDMDVIPSPEEILRSGGIDKLHKDSPHSQSSSRHSKSRVDSSKKREERLVTEPDSVKMEAIDVDVLMTGLEENDISRNISDETIPKSAASTPSVFSKPSMSSSKEKTQTQIVSPARSSQTSHPSSISPSPNHTSQAKKEEETASISNPSPSPSQINTKTFTSTTLEEDNDIQIPSSGNALEDARKKWQEIQNRKSKTERNLSTLQRKGEGGGEEEETFMSSAKSAPMPILPSTSSSDLKSSSPFDVQSTAESSSHPVHANDSTPPPLLPSKNIQSKPSPPISSTSAEDLSPSTSTSHLHSSQQTEMTSPIRAVVKNTSKPPATASPYRSFTGKPVPESPAHLLTKESPTRSLTKESPAHLLTKESPARSLTKGSPARSLVKVSPARSLTKGALANSHPIESPSMNSNTPSLPARSSSSRPSSRPASTRPSPIHPKSASGQTPAASVHSLTTKSTLRRGHSKTMTNSQISTAGSRKNLSNESTDELMDDAQSAPTTVQGEKEEGQVGQREGEGEGDKKEQAITSQQTPKRMTVGEKVALFQSQSSSPLPPVLPLPSSPSKTSESGVTHVKEEEEGVMMEDGEEEEEVDMEVEEYEEYEIVEIEEGEEGYEEYEEYEYVYEYEEGYEEGEVIAENEMEVDAADGKEGEGEGEEQEEEKNFKEIYVDENGMMFDPELLASFEKAIEECSNEEEWTKLSSTPATPLPLPKEDPLDRSSSLTKKSFIPAGAFSYLAGGVSEELLSKMGSPAQGGGEDQASPSAAALSGPLYSRNPLSRFERRPPPGGEESVVLYVTTLRMIRKTFEECNSIRNLLQQHFLDVDERDISIHSDFRIELKSVLGAAVSVPRLFVKGHYIGGAEEVLRMNEEGTFKEILQGLHKSSSVQKACDGCAGYRFVPCMDCNGSKKIYYEDGLDRCPECNENGLVRCPVCN